MPSVFSRLLLFLSSYFPLALILLFLLVSRQPFGRYLDCIARGDNLYPFSKDRFQRMFRCFELVRRHGEEMLAAIAATIEAADPGAALLPYLVAGGTDARAFPGIKVYGFMPARYDTRVCALAHAHDERTRIDDLLFATRCLYDVVTRFRASHTPPAIAIGGRRLTICLTKSLCLVDKHGATLTLQCKEVVGDADRCTCAREGLGADSRGVGAGVRTIRGRPGARSTSMCVRSNDG